MNRNQDPLPWVDARSDSPESLRRALGAVGQGPSQEELAQLATATQAALSGSAAAALTKGAGLSLSGAAGIGKVLALVAGVGVAGAGAVWMGKGPPSHAAPTRAAVDPGPAAAKEDRPPPADPAVVGPVTGTPTPARLPSIRAARAARTPVEIPTEPSAPPAAAPLARATDELELLSQARALLGGRPDRALALAHEHEARFPQGKLAQERDALIVQALRRLGLAAEARQADETFQARYPNSLYNRAVETPSAEHR